METVSQSITDLCPRIRNGSGSTKKPNGEVINWEILPAGQSHGNVFSGELYESGIDWQIMTDFERLYTITTISSGIKAVDYNPERMADVTKMIDERITDKHIPDSISEIIHSALHTGNNNDLNLLGNFLQKRIQEDNIPHRFRR